jgi:hypothetical protein
MCLQPSQTTRSAHERRVAGLRRRISAFSSRVQTLSELVVPHRLPELTDDDYRRDHPLQDLLDGGPVELESAGRTAS